MSFAKKHKKGLHGRDAKATSARARPPNQHPRCLSGEHNPLACITHKLGTCAHSPNAKDTQALPAKVQGTNQAPGGGSSFSLAPKGATEPPQQSPFPEGRKEDQGEPRGCCPLVLPVHTGLGPEHQPRPTPGRM